MSCLNSPNMNYILNITHNKALIQALPISAEIKNVDCTIGNAKCQLDWCKERQHQILQQCVCVHWRDESHFTTWQSDEYIWFSFSWFGLRPTVRGNVFTTFIIFIISYLEAMERRAIMCWSPWRRRGGCAEISQPTFWEIPQSLLCPFMKCNIHTVL